MEIGMVRGYSGEITVPGDKSVSHRSIMLGSLAKGTTEVEGFLDGADCLSSIDCFRKLGVKIEPDLKTKKVLIHGNGLHGLKEPVMTLDTGNSGTTTRLMSGILAAQDFASEITGDASICKRPMKRIMEPLRQMGGNIVSIMGNDCAPLRIVGSKLHGIDYLSPVASAQVKSAILFAGLYADGETSVTEPYVSRDHSERMLKNFGADLSVRDTRVTIRPAEELFAQHIVVPGDISSAAYFIVAGLIAKNSCITIKNVGINPTRDGILRVCKAMGANITIEPIKSDGEPVADITVRSSDLVGTEISGSLIPTLIDEIPAIAILACFAKGTTIIRDAAELKVKESNRIDAMVTNLLKMGADVEATADGMIIHGGKQLHGAEIDSKLDHRIAMSFYIAGSQASGITKINGAECVNISYPDFFADIKRLQQ